MCKTPRGHWKVLSTIAAMTVNGVPGYGSSDGATDTDTDTDTDTFLAFLREGLVPHLLPGQVAVLDNLPAHKSPEVDELTGSAGAGVLRLPP